LFVIVSNIVITFRKEKVIPTGMAFFFSCYARSGTRKGGTGANTGVKLRAGEQFLARGRVRCLQAASGRDVDCKQSSVVICF
jgi:hypothetical protein